jgi:hypothetical protein
MDQDNYGTYRLWVIDDYFWNIDKRHWIAQASIARAFDDSIRAMSFDATRRVAVIVSLSIICIRSGFLPDHLDAMLINIVDILNLLNDDDKVCYRDYLATLDCLVTHVPYSVATTESSCRRAFDSLIPPAMVN